MDAQHGPGQDVSGLQAWGRGNVDTRDQLLPLVYQELRRRAAAYLRRERVGHTLQPTALVHEAYLRLVKQDRIAWQNRAQFFGVAAQMMRRILVDRARARRMAKRSGRWTRVMFDEAVALRQAPEVDPAGPRSRAHRPGDLRRPQESGRRAAVLRRSLVGGERTRARRLCGHGGTGVAGGLGVAPCPFDPHASP
jgi:hypothetical protein